MVKVEIIREEAPFLLKGIDEKGHEVYMDSVPKFGGKWAGFRPMHLLLVSLGGCAVMDVVAILGKMRQEVKDIKAEVTAEPIPNSKPTLFQKIHVHFVIKGDIDEEKLKKALELTMEKYCSVILTVRPAVPVSYDYELIK